MRVVGFQEKPPREEALSTLCNCGIYAFEPQIFDYIEPGAFVDWAKDVFPALLEDGLPFHCWELESYWNDVGNISSTGLSNFDALLGRVASKCPAVRSRRECGSARAPRLEAGVRLEPPILAGRRLPHRVRRRASRSAHHRRRLRRRARRRARGRHPVGRRQGRARLAPRRQHPGPHTWSCTTRPWCARTRSSATAPRSRRTRLVDAGARLEPRTCVGPDGPGGGKE